VTLINSDHNDEGWDKRDGMRDKDKGCVSRPRYVSIHVFFHNFLHYTKYFLQVSTLTTIMDYDQGNEVRDEGQGPRYGINNIYDDDD
jgi:hypothetical protein